jgi:hypothetical protein
VTTGGMNGTVGGPRFRPGPWAAIALVGAVVCLVNTTSLMLEAQREGEGVDFWGPFVLEFSSYLVILALAPLIGRAMARVPLRRDDLPRFLLVHAALTAPFSLLHVAGMTALRVPAYWLAGERYGFFDDGWALPLLYEWRKDVLAYALLAAVYWAFRRRSEPPAPAPGSDRIEIRDGAAATFLAPADILYVEAAGNYVEFHTALRSHLVRGTLSAWEAKLSRRGFARVHRSRLVNRARIGALKPTPSGDVEITLDDGRALLGSRRYRAALESAEPPR